MSLFGRRPTFFIWILPWLHTGDSWLGLSFIKFETPTKMIKVGRGGYMEQQEEGISMNLAGS